MHRRIWLVATVVALAGCTDQSIGRGPVHLSPSAQAHYGQYKRTIGPTAFVLSEAGGSFYTYCPSTACYGGGMSKALQMCRRADQGACHVYDLGGRVVWRRDEPAPIDPSTTLIRCQLRGSPILTTETACRREGGSPVES